MKVLVTGASGLLGRHLVELGRSRHEIHAPAQADLDVTDRRAVGVAVSELAPRAVLHCAAYTDVDGAEREPERAMEVNAQGARFVAEAARAASAAVVYVSTDYVFDGEARSPYREDDPPRPLSHYGRSKLEGERRVRSAHPEGALVVRTGWLYGAGKGFVDWVRMGLDDERELPLVEDQVGSPTWAREFAEALWLLVEGGYRGMFHFVNSGETSWLGLGEAVVRELGRSRAAFRPVPGSALGRPAPRPRYSPLSVERFEKTTGRRVLSWREALRRYLSSGGRKSPSTSTLS